MDNEELQKQAQAKLVEARRLLDEAGELAKRGQFYLSFMGSHFIPSSLADEESLRQRALSELQAEGRYNGCEYVYDDPEFPRGKSIERDPTPFSELNEDEIEEEVDALVESYIDNLGIPYEAREYGARDRWWKPSTC